MSYVGINLEPGRVGLDVGAILMHKESLEYFCIVDLWKDSWGLVMCIRNIESKGEQEIMRADLSKYILGGCA